MSVVAVVTVLTPNLDGNGAPSFKNKVTSFQVLIGGAAELNVHLLNETKEENCYFRHHIYSKYTKLASLPFHCSPWLMQCGLCHHVDRNVASYVPPRLPPPSQSGSLQPEQKVSLLDINIQIGPHHRN